VTPMLMSSSRKELEAVWRSESELLERATIKG
jgi:hypothetical protein